ncbi:hypothetical protein PFISCL1PPCAC_10181 [Pristionchus fissidentatus]|uniref:Ankyrin repeat-containing protein n=1 Tax=Pristionchus fissidentatus TaxID=1538716 RepID=A0AAV5VKF5_9BILA|nr:hypothetical protein PFISCL1PPCAC_10181 [Pristionchus fissidentatus]
MPSPLEEVHSLIREKRIEEAKRIIDKDHSLMVKTDESGRTVMHHAAVSGLLPLVELAITGAKLDIDLEDDLGWTALMIASSSGKEDIVRYLLSHPTCNVSHSNKNGQTPLHYAASKGHAKVVSLLIENGADINGKDKYGATALHRAASQGRDDIVKILKASAGIRIDLMDGEGKTPLFLAVEENRLDCITALVLGGADASIQNKEGVAPYDVVQSEVAGKALLDARRRYNEAR